MKLTSKHLTVAGVKVAIRIDAGPWVEGVNPDLIKLRPKAGSLFPQAVREALAVENKSDSRGDYFEADSIRLVPGHPLYAAAREAAGLAPLPEPEPVRRSRCEALNRYLLATNAWNANALHDAMRIIGSLKDDPKPGHFPGERGRAWLQRIWDRLQAEDARRLSLLYRGHA